MIGVPVREKIETHRLGDVLVRVLRFDTCKRSDTFFYIYILSCSQNPLAMPLTRDG